MALRGKLQMINGQGNLFYPETERFVKDLPASSLYTVISIIGPQSSGKSYLLNKLFDTQFEVLDARNGRKQTTKGIWMANNREPCMIIMDMEGMDGKERKDDTLFERQSALFSLAISDVMLLNMWHNEIGRHKAANLDLLTLVFQERVTIEAPITEIIIVVRDHDYDEVSPDITKQQVEQSVTEIWRQVNSSIPMSKYVKVTVKDFPHKKEERLFSQKSEDLRNLLRTAAANGTLQQTSHAPSFAYRSQIIWDKILRNERLIAEDQKVAMSTHVCHVVMNSMLKCLEKEQEYKSLMMPITSIKEFNAILKSFLGKLLERYDEETRTLDKAIRNDQKAPLQKKIVQKFEQTFDNKAGDLVDRMLKEAESEVQVNLKKLNKWDKSAVTVVRRRHLEAFDRESLGDVQPHFERIRAKHRDDFAKRLTNIIEEAATEIKIAASTSRCPDIMNGILMSLRQEKEYGILMSVTTLFEEYNSVLASFLARLLHRYEKKTAIYDASVSNEIKAKLEYGIVHMFEQTFDNKTGDLVHRMLSEAESKVAAYFKNLNKWPDASAVTEVRHLHLKAFDGRSQKDVHRYFEGLLKKHRDVFVPSLVMIAEKEANKFKLEMSTQECYVVMDRTLKVLQQEKEYISLMVSVKIKEFNITLKSFLCRLLARYEEETRTFDSEIRNEIKAKLQSEIVHTFEQTFDNMVGDLASTILRRVDSEVPDYIKSSNKWEASDVTEVRHIYLKAFDDESLEDVQPHFEEIRAKHRDDFEKRLTHFTENKASEIKIAVSNPACEDVMNSMLKSLPQEKEFELLMSVNSVEKFNKIFATYLPELFTRYEEKTRIYDAEFKTKIGEKFESEIVDMFQDRFNHLAGDLVNRMVPKAELKITADLEKLEQLENSAITEVLKIHLKEFDNLSRKDHVHPFFEGILGQCRGTFVTKLTNFTEEIANKIQKKRSLKGAVKACVKIILGTAWAVATWNKDMMYDGVATMYGIWRRRNYKLAITAA